MEKFIVSKIKFGALIRAKKTFVSLIFVEMNYVTLG